MCFKKIWGFFRRKDVLSAGSPSAGPQTMNIEEFVQASMIGIMSGIRGAQKEYAEGNSAYDPIISPAWAPSTSDIGGSTRGHADKIHEFEFDLAITVSGSSALKTEGKAGVIVVGLSQADIGYAGMSEEAHAMISRIRFKIPVRYPLAKLGMPVWDEKKE
jgi:hypothetical protein